MRLPIRAAHLNWRLTAYASGNLGKNLLWGTLEVALLFVLTDMLLISPAIAGSLILLSLLFDAVLDPLLGYAVDRLRHPLLRLRTLLLVGTPLAGLSFVLLLTIPIWPAPSVLAVGAVLIFFRFAYSLVDMPHNAALATFPVSSAARGRIAIYRFFFSSIASLIIAISIGQLIETDGKAVLSAEGLSVFGVLAAATAVMTLLLSWAAIGGTQPRHTELAPPLSGYREVLGELRSDRRYRQALLAGTVASFYLPLFSKTLFHLGEYVLQDREIVAPTLTALIVGQFLGLPLWAFRAHRSGSLDALRAAHIVAATGFFAALVFCSTDHGLLPLAAVLIGIGGAGVYALIWGVIADAVTENVMAAHGLKFALAIFGQKASIGLASGLFGLCLHLVDYQPGARVTGLTQAVIFVFAIVAPLLLAMCVAELLRDRKR